MQSEMWVFGYGSLLWNPGFEVHHQMRATLHGYGRSFCMRSIHHRGTEEDPGLVLALDVMPGALCEGVALGVVPGQEEATLAYLRERELVSSAYVEHVLPVTLEDGGEREALAYVIDPDHVQYCAALPLEEQAQIIARAHGGRGPNAEYLMNTADHLAELGVHDAELQWLAARVRSLCA